MDRLILWPLPSKSIGTKRGKRLVSLSGYDVIRQTEQRRSLPFIADLWTSQHYDDVWPLLSQLLDNTLDFNNVPYIHPDPDDTGRERQDSLGYIRSGGLDGGLYNLRSRLKIP